jgi:allophanate hydrolase
MLLSQAHLFTLDDWRQAYLAGAQVHELVLARARQAFASAPSAWIYQLEESSLSSRCNELAAVLRSHPSPAACLQALPLYGVPFVVKDNIDVQGLPTTAACPAFRRMPNNSATVVARLLQAGAVLIGKTNLDQFATGLVGTRSPHGAPASVFDSTRISGGSSSGSAVLVGAGCVPFALGTDTAGSGRIPATFNGVVGLKPTPGRVSTAGVLPACRSLDCVSIFALTVADAATVLEVVEGADALDEYSAFVPGAESFAAPLRVGVPAQAELDASLGYGHAWRTACADMREQGAVVQELDFAPLHEVARLLYEGPWVAERYAVVQSLMDNQPQALDATVRKVISKALDLTAVDTFRAQYALRRAQQTLRAWWHQIDVLMVPTAPTHPTFEQVAADPVGTNAHLGTYTNFVNLLGWSALAVPAGSASSGLPFGVTFIGPGGADAALVRLGLEWQRQMGLPLGATGRQRNAVTCRMPACEPSLALAVVGAHLSGLPLNGQLTERGAVLVESTATAARYRLHALPGTTPPKPGLIRVAQGGHAIAVEVWRMPMAQVGSFLALIPPPLGLGSIELADGRRVHGFLCESADLQGAADISHHGGWRAYLASR